MQVEAEARVVADAGPDAIADARPVRSSLRSQPPASGLPFQYPLTPDPPLTSDAPPLSNAEHLLSEPVISNILTSSGPTSWQNFDNLPSNPTLTRLVFGDSAPVETRLKLSDQGYPAFLVDSGFFPESVRSIFVSVPCAAIPISGVLLLPSLERSRNV